MFYIIILWKEMSYSPFMLLNDNCKFFNDNFMLKKYNCMLVYYISVLNCAFCYQQAAISVRLCVFYITCWNILAISLHMSLLYKCTSHIFSCVQLEMHLFGFIFIQDLIALSLVHHHSILVIILAIALVITLASQEDASNDAT